jgi:hypothetical protein
MRIAFCGSPELGYAYPRMTRWKLVIKEAIGRINIFIVEFYTKKLY